MTTEESKAFIYSLPRTRALDDHLPTIAAHDIAAHHIAGERLRHSASLYRMSRETVRHALRSRG